MTRKYITKSGKTRYKPSFAQVQRMDNNNSGFCINCGKIRSCVEPDAERYQCDHCNQPTVFGSEFLVLHNLIY